MKSYIIRFVIIIVSWCISLHLLMAQEGGFHYQAALRTADGRIISDQPVKLRITIGEDENNFFTEEHIARTNPFGILNLSIGTGIGSGSLAEIPWGAPGLQMQIELDEGSGFRLLGNTSLMPVPYALFAKEAENSNLNIEDITLSDEGDLTIVLSDQRIFNLGNIKGSDGDQGEPGPMGPQGEPGPQGPAGRDGTGVKIIGSVATEQNLDLNHLGSEGDMVIVAESGVGFVWDGSQWIEVGNIRGPEGPTGAIGPQGVEGPQGVAGPAGPQGVAGLQGPQGEPGPQGEIGPTGLPGPKGDKGDPGQDGTAGTAGEQGPPGPQGDQGEKGESGPQGIQGEKGDAGVQGPKGDQGDPGPAGPKGDQGDLGPKGDQGDQGPQGLKGDQGDPGQDGTNGAQGEQGPPGPKGDQGDTGPAGRGIADVRDQDNDLVVDFDDGTSKNVGNFKGPKGDQGDPGPKGDQGDQGPQGLKGDQGDPGQDGTDGAPGEQGPPGPKGDQGDIGPAGRGIADVRDQDNDLVVDFDDGTSKNVGNFKGPKGDQGDPGQDGSNGQNGTDGKDGLHCWDLNGNGQPDANEDVNNDGNFDALDCKGPKGDKGDPGSGGFTRFFGSVRNDARILYSGSGNWAVGTDQGAYVIDVPGNVAENNCSVLVTPIGSANAPNVFFKNNHIHVSFNSPTSFAFSVLIK